MCLENKIGLKGCTDEEGLIYVNALPSIKLKKFAIVADEESVTGRNLFNEFLAEAEDAVIDDLIYIMGRDHSFQFNSFVQSEIVGNIDPYELTDKEDKNIGIAISRRYFDDPYVDLKVEWIELYSADEVVKDIYVHSMTSVEVISHSFTVGINRIPIDFNGGQEVVIYMNVSDISLAKRGGCSCGEDSFCGVCSCECFKIKSMSSDVGVAVPWECLNTGLSYCSSGSASLGYRVCASCMCNKSDFFCKFVDEYKRAARYKIGIMLHEENLGSDSKHPLVRNTKEDSEYWLAKWQGTPDPKTGFDQKSTYWMELKKAAARIASSMGKNTKCIKCTGVSLVNSIP